MSSHEHERWDAFAHCSPAVQKWRPLILAEARRFRNKCGTYRLQISWVDILSHAVALACVAERKLQPGHPLTAAYLRKYLLGLHREFIERPLAEHRRQLKAEERAHERRYEAKKRPASIEELIRSILFPRQTYGVLSKSQRKAVRGREKARAAVAEKFLNVAGLSELHRTMYLAGNIEEAAAFHKTTVDYAYKLRDRSRTKIDGLIDDLRRGEHPELALAMKRQFPRSWWEVCDGLRWARGSQKPLRPSHVKAKIAPAVEDLTAALLNEFADEDDWAKQAGLDTEGD
jgi:hypothetical protein